MSLLFREAAGTISNFPMPNERLPPPISWQEYRNYYHDSSFEIDEYVPSESAIAAMPVYQPPYDAHGGYYRSINIGETDLHEAWKASPPRLRDGVPLAPDYVKPVFDLPESFRGPHAFHSRWPNKLPAQITRKMAYASSNAAGSRQFSPSSHGSGSAGSAGSSSQLLQGRSNQNGHVAGSIPVAPNGQGAQTTTNGRRKGFWRRLVKMFRRPKTVPLPLPPPPPIVVQPLEEKPPIDDNPYAEPVPLHEWKQYGYWARPFVNDLQITNSPVSSEISVTTEQLEEAIRNVRDPEELGGAPHPERWMIGLKHRALASCPERWAKLPDPRAPLPFPWEVHLNPLLQHPLFGAQPLLWAVFADPMRDLTVHFGHGAIGRVPLGDGDMRQPATWPWLTTMVFCDVLGDGAPEFPWPFSIHNPRGIRVIDVLSGIYRCFHTPLLDDEFNSWNRMRQDACRRAHVARQNLPLEGGDRVMRDLRRRSDALGAMMWFRGIEPSVTGRGWMIAFGPY